MARFAKSRSVQPHVAALLFFLLPLLTLAGRAGLPEDLAARAIERSLWTNRYWHTLGHYESTWTGFKSRIDDPKFFLAPDGRTNPRAELLATLAACFAPVEGTNEARHAVHRFPARLHWLKEQLNWDGSGLPMQETAKFRQVYEYLAPSSVAMIYPAAYMGSPASMFGHTMIVFDAKDHNRLLSQAMTYAAFTGQGFGPLFAIEGIFGFYKGYYSALPYYDKVEEYTAVGHRDVWEYELDFTQAEVDQMFRHAWELQNIFSYYYFFTENCSFNLFYLLDAARPSLRTTDYNRPFVIPIDTVKYLDDLGLVRKKSWRPAQVSRIRHLAGQMAADEVELGLAVAGGTTTAAGAVKGLPDREAQIRLLDFASEYTQFLYADEELTPAQYRPRFLATLKARSALGQVEEGRRVEPEMPDRPEEGHPPARLALGAGVQEKDFFTALHYRPAYHGLLDNDIGYTRGAQIEFLNLDVRWYPERERAELQNMDLVEVTSLAARDRLFQPGSWKVKMGVTQSDRNEDQDRLMAHVNTGAGLTWRTGENGIWFVMAELEGQVGRDFDDGYAIGAGPSAGLVQSLTRSWKVVALARTLYMGVGDDFWGQRYSLDQDFRICRTVSLGFGVLREQIDETEKTEVQARVNWYF